MFILHNNIFIFVLIILFLIVQKITLIFVLKIRKYCESITNLYFFSIMKNIFKF